MSSAVQKHRVALLGLGPRGHSHMQAFMDNPERFEVAAICDLNTQRLADAAEQYGVRGLYSDARTMLREVKPDVFCFVTPVSVRLDMVELAAQEGVRALAFEKPIALTIREAYDIKRIIDDNCIKAVVSHQLKYLTSMQTLRQMIQSGALGEITHVHATTVPWHTQLGTHFMDYLMWANGGWRALWAVGHVHGRHHLSAADGHTGADFLLGEFMLANGVRGILECGYLAPPHLPRSHFWLDDRLTFYGTEGFAWADNTNRWNIVTSRRCDFRPGEDKEPRDLHERRMQARYMLEFADWLDDDHAPHPCRYEAAYQGYEALQAIQISAMERRRVDLPLDPSGFYDMNERMRVELPDAADSREWQEHGDAPS